MDNYKMNEFLGTITSDFIKVADQIKNASYEIRKNGFNYPIFVISKTSIENIAPVFIERNSSDNKWSYHVSYLEIMIKNKIFDSEKTNQFKETYKNPDEFCCLFIIDPEFCGVLYVPYPNDDESDL